PHVSYAFFFQGSGDHPDLHSFPTRRSSDLKTRIARMLVALLDDAMPALAGCEISDDPLSPICQACRTRVAEQGDRAEIVWIPREDRKSTRLNSSHDQISYAVFCLKKKNTNN